MKPWLSWVRFWNEDESPEALALVRITFGTALVLNVLQQMLLDDPVRLYADGAHGGTWDLPGNLPWFSLFRFLPPTGAAAWSLLSAQLLAALCLAAGLRPRAAALAALVLQATFYDRLVMVRYDGDNVFRVCLFLLALAPSGAAWSLDARAGRGRDRVPAWGRRLLLAQLVIIYVRTGVVKMGSTWSVMDDWQAVYLAMNLPPIARWPGDWAAHPLVYPLTQVGTFVASWWEALFFLVPLQPWWRRRWPGARWSQWDVRPLFAAIGIAMHGTLLVVADVGLFSIVMVSLYPTMLRPEEARRALAWARPSA